MTGNLQPYATPQIPASGLQGLRPGLRLPGVPATAMRSFKRFLLLHGYPVVPEVTRVA